MLSHFLKNRALAGMLIGALISIILSLGIVSGLFENLHKNFADNLYTRENPSDNIVIIAVDDKSTQPSPEGFGRFSQWTRERFTRLLNILENENPKVTILDFIFHTRTETVSREKLLKLMSEVQQQSNKEKLEIYDNFFENYTEYGKNPIDREFSKKLQEFKNIILAAGLNAQKELIKPLYEFSKNADLGITQTFLDETGVFRRSNIKTYIESEDRYYDDLSLAAAKKFLDKEELNIPLENGKMLVNYFGDPYSFKMISFVDVINEKFDPEYFNDKIVLIGGTSSKEFHDEYITPKSNKTPMPGVEIHANKIQTILQEKFLQNQGKFSRVITASAIAIALTIILNYLGIIFSIIVSVLAIVAYLATAHIFYRNGLIINMVYPFAAIILAYLASWVYKYFIADRKKREMKSAFSHYVSDKLVTEISKNPDMVKLGGEKKVVTVFFSDIKDSTTISEKTEITSWVEQINEYFTVMEKIIQALDGTVDKYEGDAIMGFWNAPLPQENHVLRAHLTALEMKKGLRSLHQKWQKEGKPLINFRIGINTGEAIVGNFGSESRFDYTVMGDTVNTASRLESSANKTYGTTIIAAGFENLPENKRGQIIIRELDTVILPGKKEPVNIYELICQSKDITPEIENLIKIYEQGLQAYRQKDWTKAIQNFEILKEDLPSQTMLARCKVLQEGKIVTGIDKNMIFKIVNK
ncbi:CHASE2 domain-containing protein [Candidatus Peregrinibacteria bacterium]|nr:CHASE2 domain-containing protein [Candidatus Peregrinibacteria bacterium]